MARRSLWFLSLSCSVRGTAGDSSERKCDVCCGSLDNWFVNDLDRGREVAVRVISELRVSQLPPVVDAFGRG